MALHSHRHAGCRQPNPRTQLRGLLLHNGSCSNILQAVVPAQKHTPPRKVIFPIQIRGAIPVYEIISSNFFNWESLHCLSKHNGKLVEYASPQHKNTLHWQKVIIAIRYYNIKKYRKYKRYPLTYFSYEALLTQP